MRRREFLEKSGTALSAFLISGLMMENCSSKRRKPNIIYILADDLGYGELGCYGQKIIKTPNLDRLAKTGMKFTDHYSGSPVCAPSRCVLLTGKHSGHAYIRGNDEMADRGNIWDFEAVAQNPQLEGQRPLRKKDKTMAEYLKTGAYKTACIGKWGLGPAYSEGSPNKQGFDFFYGYNCQRQAHTYYPVHLYRNEERISLNNKLVPPHTKFDTSLDPYDEQSYADFTLNEYAPDLMLAEAIKWLDANQKSPFFLYYPSPLPHLPLQAPKEYVDQYRDIFGDEEPYTEGSYYPCRYPKATYAGMITYLDDQVGKIIEKVKEIGQLENTLIIFSSDNGATYTGGAATEFFKSNGIFGAKYGDGKGFLNEGGIRVPMIANWPDKISAGTTSNHISAFWDVLPTFCDVADVAIPKNTDGISFLPELLGHDSQKSHEFLYWEFPAYEGQQAVRMGKWKGLRKNIFKGNMAMELYDLQIDPRENNNIAKNHPKIVNKIRGIMEKEHEPAAIKKFHMNELEEDI